MTQRRVENTRVHFWTFSPVSFKECICHLSAYDTDNDYENELLYEDMNGLTKNGQLSEKGKIALFHRLMYRTLNAIDAAAKG